MEDYSNSRVANGLIILGLVIFGVAGYLWYSKIYNEPSKKTARINAQMEEKFWKTIENGLRTRSVTKETVTSNPNGGTTVRSRMIFEPADYVSTKTTTRQRKTTQVATNIETSTYETPTATYVKYDKIETNDKKADGSDFNFEKAVNVWARQADISAESDEAKQAQKEQFAGNLIQLVPFAYLDKASAVELTNKLRAAGAYQIKFKESGKVEDGLTGYKVVLNAKAYVTVLSEILKKAGYGELASLDASQYDATSSLDIDIGIDGSNLVRRIGASNSSRSSNGGNSDFEVYRDYGAMVSVPNVGSAIDFMDLQTRLQEAR